MGNDFIPICKMGKKERKKYYSSKRNSWGVIDPCTKIVASKKKYNRNKIKRIDLCQNS